MNHGGRVAMLGLPHDPYPIDWSRVITHMITIKGIYGREMYDTWYAMSSMLQTSAPLREALRSVITHRLPAERWPEAFDAIALGALRQGHPRLELSDPRGGQRERDHPRREHTCTAQHGPGVAATLAEIEAAGLTKHERELTSPQAAHITTESGAGAELLREQLPRPRRPPRGRGGGRRPPCGSGASAWRASGSSAARRSCTSGSSTPISDFLGTDDTILFSSCFDANGGVFEVLFGEEDAIISDALNHASLIDGIRLSKAARYRYRNADMADLEAQLVAAAAAPARAASSPTASSRWTATSLPWTGSATWPSSTTPWCWWTTPTPSGFVGPGGRGTPDALRGPRPGRHPDRHPGQGARAAPPAGTSAATRRSSPCCASGPGPTCSRTPSPRRSPPGSLWAPSSSRPRRSEARATLRPQHRAVPRADDRSPGFDLLPGEHPITPVMFPGEDGARRAARIADRMLAEGVYVIAFSFPVVPARPGPDPRPALGGALRGRRTPLRRRVRQRPRRRGGGGGRAVTAARRGSTETRRRR